MADNKETLEWCVWIDPGTKTISLNKIHNGKKKTFETEKEMIDFCAKLMMKGFKLG